MSEIKDWTIEDNVEPVIHIADDFEVVDLKEIARLRRIEKAAIELDAARKTSNELKDETDIGVLKWIQAYLLPALDNLRKALQGD